MHCQIAKVTGKACRAVADLFFIPQGSTLQYAIEDGQAFCRKDAIILQKRHKGSTLLAIGEVITGTSPYVEDSLLTAATTETERTLLYTTAPENYDSFGARTEQVIGTYGPGSRYQTGGELHTITYRLISIPAEHAERYQNRCGSGMYPTHTQEEWDELINEAFFRKKFVAADDFTLSDITQRKESFMAKRVTKPKTVSAPPIAVARPTIVKQATQVKTTVKRPVPEPQTLTPPATETIHPATRGDEETARRRAGQQLRDSYKVTPVAGSPLDAYPDLRNALADGGGVALLAFHRAIAQGILRVIAPHVAKASHGEKQVPQNGRRQFTETEQDDICARAAAGESLPAIRRSYGAASGIIGIIVKKRAAQTS